MLVDAHHAAETFAAQAGAHGIVEGEEVIARFFEADAVGLEAGGESLEVAFGIEAEQAFAVALIECRFDRVVEARHAVFRTVDGQAVEEEEEAAFGQGRFVARHSGGAFDGFVHAYHVAVEIQAREALLEQHFDLLFERALVEQTQGSEYGEARAGGMAEGGGDNVVGAVAAHFLAAHGRVGVSYAGEEQAEIFVDLGARADGGTRVVRLDFLLNSDGRRQSFDVVALGLVHAAEKLAGVGRKTFDITPLAFGIEGVEGQ